MKRKMAESCIEAHSHRQENKIEDNYASFFEKKVKISSEPLIKGVFFWDNLTCKIFSEITFEGCLNRLGYFWVSILSGRSLH